MTLSVAVIGVGTMGSMALWQLSRRGIRAVGFEQFDIGHHNGAYSGETRMFRTAYANGAHWTPALIRAQALWRELEAETGTQLLEMNGFLSIAPPDDPHIRQLLSARAEAAPPVRLLQRDAAAERFPAIRLAPDEVAVFDPAGGLIKPERAVMAAIERARGLGAQVYSASKVIGLDTTADGVTVLTPQGRHNFDAAIVTTGAWASDLFGTGLVVPQRVALHWYLATRPGLFQPQVFPSHIRYHDGRAVCLFSMQDGTLVKAAIGGALGPLSTPLAARSADAPDAAELTDAIARFYPDLWPHPVRSRSYADGFTTDGDPLIGLVPGTGNIAAAIGFSAHGFKVAPLVGAALADLVMTQATQEPIGHLALARQEQRVAHGWHDRRTAPTTAGAPPGSPPDATITGGRS